MPYTASAAARYAEFAALRDEVWESQDLGSSAYSQMCGYMPSDWNAHLTNWFRMTPQQILVEADRCYRLHNGIDWDTGRHLSA